MSNQARLKEIINSDLDHWTADRLEQLKSVELSVCCKVIGIPYTGDRVRKLQRLTTCAALLYRLRLYDRAGEGTIETSHLKTMTAAFTRAELSVLCRQAAIAIPHSKYAKARALILWRRNCLAHGAAFVKQASRTRYRQLWLV